MDTLDKKYYKIKDVAQFLDVPQSTLRFWEKEFPQIRPMRSPHNIRYYTPKDIETLRIIHYLLKTKGLRLEAAKEQMRVNSANISRQLEILDRLLHLRSQLEGLRKALSIRK